MRLQLEQGLVAYGVQRIKISSVVSANQRFDITVLEDRMVRIDLAPPEGPVLLNRHGRRLEAARRRRR
jgi:hypothetical protein